MIDRFRDRARLGTLLGTRSRSLVDENRGESAQHSEDRSNVHCQIERNRPTVLKELLGKRIDRKRIVFVRGIGYRGVRFKFGEVGRRPLLDVQYRSCVRSRALFPTRMTKTSKSNEKLTILRCNNFPILQLYSMRICRRTINLNRGWEIVKVHEFPQVLSFFEKSCYEY